MQTPKLNKPIAQSDPPKVRPIGTGRRAFVRYPVVLGATIVSREGREIKCEMKDFCMGGMLLRYPPLAAPDQSSLFALNDRIVVRTIVPMADGNKELQFQAHVARVMQDGLGLAFMDPEQDAMLTMQEYALQVSLDNSQSGQPSPGLEMGGNRGSLFGRRFSDVLAGCGRITQGTMDSLLEQLGNRLNHHLFDLSRESDKTEVQNIFFNASEDIKNNQDKLINAIRANFKERLQAVYKKTSDDNKAKEQRIEDLSLDNISLIGDEDLGAWLAISDVTSKLEEKFKQSLATLEARLSVLFNAQISHANNPYGPALFAESFQAGLSQFSFKESVNTACYAALKEILINLLPDLYVKLNAILIEYGILPELTYGMIQHSAIMKNKLETVAVTAGTESEMKRQAVKDMPVPPAAPSTAEASTDRHAVPQDLYQVVNDLRALRQDIVRRRSQIFPGVDDFSSGMDIADASKWFATSDLVTAITELQASPQDFVFNEDQLSHVKSRVVAALLSRAGEGSFKKLNPRDSNVLEVAGDLLGAMQTDPLVAESVKPWLKQLELPVIKMALLDPSLFFDHSHVTRQVVNNIAQLEFYRQDRTISKQNAISAAIEGLLDKVAKEDADGAVIFEEILDKLNRLIKIQNQAYEDNVRDLIKECEVSPPEPDIFEPGGQDDGNVSTAEKHKWLMHARRLRQGESVLLTFPGDNPQRVRVGWIDDKKTTYVFVNLRGIRESVLNADDVATMMRLGILEPQENAADPAMDRAQYVIMQDLYQQVLHESTHDSMTGLINRREFDRVVSDAVTSAKRDNERHVLLFIDIDKFSAINNSCGYAGGDQLLQSLVKILQESLPGNAEIARLGSDQFGIILERCSLDDALAIAEQQIESVAGYKMEWKGDVFSVTLSMGLVPISARSDDVDELLHSAESSCNIAKDTGGNRLQVFHAGHSRIAHQTEVMKWIGKIDKMLEEDALEIRCQRIQAIAGDSAEQPHFEILVGVKDEHGNVGSPTDFIKAAEWYRRMTAVDRHVISKAFAWIENNPGVVEKIAGFSINLSGQSLNEDGFVEYILEKLQTLSVPREKICFEVTETVGIASLSDATLFIERVKELGCRFSLDDFGSGMSSYGYLKNLPVDTVKIDGVFVQNMVAGSSDYAVVKSITEIAHFMNKKVVAEFVENAEVLELLREIGVDYVQGYMIDRPDSIDRLLTMDSIH
jgi:diguanylate cyclase (GGDEF)-like protein